MKQFQRCKRCVMDNKSDDKIIFNDDGYCNYCTDALSKINMVYFPNKEGEEKLEELIIKLKKFNKNNKYDCIMGISGGLDSSYLAYLGATKWGLRIKAVHIDDGYDTQISKNNIEQLCNSSNNIDLTTITPDPEQYNSLLKAYILAGVPNIAAPQDNILFAYLYDYARKNNIKHFLSGGNFALESILQKGNTYDAGDSVNIKDIHKHFGSKPINKLKFISKSQRFFDEKYYKIESLRPLNYINYNRDYAFKELKEFCGFEYYGSKHLENDLTAFVQLYWLPVKYGVDKRNSHLSSMIVSGQMTREMAIAELEKPICDPEYMEDVINLILKNIEMSREEFDNIVKQEPRNHTDFKTDMLYLFIRKHILK